MPGRAAVAFVGAQVAEAAATLLAAVRGGTAVDALMRVEVAQLLKASPALWAGVGALARVDLRGKRKVGFITVSHMTTNRSCL